MLKNQRGMALVSVLIIFAITSLLGTTVYYASTKEALSSEKVQDQTQAYYFAQSGVEMAISYIKDLCGKQTNITNFDKKFYAGLNGEPEFGQHNIEYDIKYDGATGEFTIKSLGIVRKQNSAGAIATEHDLEYKISKGDILELIIGGGTGGSGGPIALFSAKNIFFYGSAGITGNVLTNATTSNKVHFNNNTTRIYSGNLYLGPDADKDIVVTYSDGGNEKANIPQGKILNQPAERIYPLPRFPSFPSDLPAKGTINTGNTGTISGRVTDQSGKGVGDVTIYISPSIPGNLAKTSVTTVNNEGWVAGHGTWAEYNSQGTVIITPVKEGYTFIPAFQKVTGPKSNIDFTAIKDNSAPKQNIEMGNGQQWAWEISEDGYYDKITVVSNRILRIDLAGGTRVLRVKEFDISQGHVTLEGSGQLILYVDNLKLNNGSTFNLPGESNSLILFYKGSDQLEFAGNTRYKGTLYAEKANIVISGSNNVIGNVITGGNTVKVTGDASVSPMVVYAPKAKLTVGGSGKILGTAVVNECTLEGAAKITVHDPLDTTVFNALDWGSAGPPSLYLTSEQPQETTGLTWRGKGKWTKI